MSRQRISAVILEHLFRMRHSYDELVDTFYWPLIDVVVWGFLTTYFTRLGGTSAAVTGFLLGGLILWIIVWRSQQDVTVSLLWDIWNRNLLNLFTTPLSVAEFMIGLVILGGLKLMATVLVAAGAAYLFYAFNLFSLGFALLPFLANLMVFGWVMGILISGVILRFGRRWQTLAWSFTVLANPIAAVYYPVSSLPPVLQLFSKALPISYVFEGMRSVLANRGFPASYLVWASILNVVYLIFVIGIFHRLFEGARESGKLAKLGE